ncbi:MAG: phospholipase, partial [Gammaproteobacteria bacterium]|nr:phospholipase [Gammaproteobacteria bacterium]NIR94953.1 phospholipase [Gammaproteobacteria bacterium]
PSLRFNWNTDTSLHFEQDNQIPFGGCHHQKVVVIDDLLAFCGGLDITRGRWDTSEHLTNNPYRTEQGSSTPRPHHDMQMAVSGP